MMKRWRLVLPFLALLFISGTGYAQDDAAEAVAEFTDHPARVVRNINGLNVRRTPAIEDDNIVGRLQPGQQVHVLAREGDWQQVRSEDGIFGWSHSDYLIDLPPRQLGETRRFRFGGGPMGASIIVDAELVHIGQYSYIYSTGPHYGAGFGASFDRAIYPEVMALWEPEIIPSHEGDERIVILMVRGNFGGQLGIAGVYHSRVDMPGEPNPHHNRVGFLELRAESNILETLAHELQHLIQHMLDDDEPFWINEGLAVFTQLYLGYQQHPKELATAYISMPRVALSEFTGDYSQAYYGAGLLLSSYIHDRLGLDALREFAYHPKNGLDGLQAILDERNSEWDVDTFYADWVLANYIHDRHPGDERYEYPILRDLQVPSSSVYTFEGITYTPAVYRSRLNQYATRYIQFLPPITARTITLELQFDGAPVQDAWLQLVQKVDGAIAIQRFRASEFKGQPVTAIIDGNAEEASIALTPFTPSDRDRTRLMNYTLTIRTVPSVASASSDGDMESESTERAASTAALLQAAKDGNALELLRLIVQTDADRRQPESESLRTALHLAAAAGHEAVVSALLLLDETDIHARDADSKTALMLANEAGHTAISELLRAAANEEEQQRQQLTPNELYAYIAAARNENPEIASDALRVAARSGLTHLVRLLLTLPDTNVDIDLLDPTYNRTPLEEAARFGYADTVSLLLELGAGLGEHEPRRWTALITAIMRRDHEILDLLLAAGADVNYFSFNGWHSLIWAVSEGYADVVAKLLAAGADPNAQEDRNNYTALHYTTEFNYIYIAELLLAAGADAAVEDVFGDTPAEAARQYGNHALANMLEAAAR